MWKRKVLDHLDTAHPSYERVDHAIKQLNLPPKEQRSDQDYARLLVFLAPPIGTPVLTHRGQGVICEPPPPLQDGRIIYSPGANGNVWVQLPDKEPDLYLINRLTILETNHDVEA